MRRLHKVSLHRTSFDWTTVALSQRISLISKRLLTTTNVIAPNSYLQKHKRHSLFTSRQFIAAFCTFGVVIASNNYLFCQNESSFSTSENNEHCTQANNKSSYLQNKSDETNHPSFDCFRAQVLRNKPLGPNTRLIRFSLSNPNERMFYTPGAFVEISGLSFNVDESFPFGKNVCRPYLPLHHLNKEGFFDIIVHTYKSPDGDMSRFLTNLKEGESVKVRGPVPRKSVDEKLQGVKRLGIIAGGSGMTAAIQFIRAFSELNDQENNSKVKIAVICSSRDADDLFYVKELDSLARRNPETFRVEYTLTRETPRGWLKKSIGRISTTLIEKTMPSPSDDGTRIVVCGPDSFVKQVAGMAAKPNHYLEDSQLQECEGLLEKCDYDASKVIIL